MARIQGHITLIGDSFSTSAVTEAIGLSPMWERKATEILGNGRYFGHCEWGINTDMISADDLCVVSETLLHPLMDVWSYLGKIGADFNAEWHILFTVYVTDDFPVLVLPSEFVKLAAEINANIGFDVYLVGDNY